MTTKHDYKKAMDFIKNSNLSTWEPGVTFLNDLSFEDESAIMAALQDKIDEEAKDKVS